MSGVSPAEFELSPEEYEAILRTQIIPQFLDGLTASASPRLLLVLGQSGAGKTTISRDIARLLKPDGGGMTLDFDRLMRFHPDFPELQERFEQDVQLYVKKDVSAWLTELDTEARRRKVHVVCELTGSKPEAARRAAELYRRVGYGVEAVVLAVPREVSRKAIRTRYRRQKAATGYGRNIPDRYHDRSYDGLLEICDDLDAGRINADSVTVLVRGGRPLYGNERDPDGQWLNPPGCRDAVEHGRGAPDVPA